MLWDGLSGSVGALSANAGCDEAEMSGGRGVVQSSLSDEHLVTELVLELMLSDRPVYGCGRDDALNVRSPLFAELLAPPGGRATALPSKEFSGNAHGEANVDMVLSTGKLTGCRA